MGVLELVSLALVSQGCTGHPCTEDPAVSMDMGRAALPHPGMLGSDSSAVCETLLLALSEQQGIAGQMPDFSNILETVLCFNCLMLGLLHTAGAGWPAGGWQTHGR